MTFSCYYCGATKTVKTLYMKRLPMFVLMSGVTLKIYVSGTKCTAHFEVGPFQFVYKYLFFVVGLDTL